MAYATSSGTLTQMIAAMATFALANGWTARTTAAHRYWSVLGKTKDNSGSRDTRITQFLMSETSGGANVITGGTATATNGVAADAAVASGVWICTNSVESRWVYDLGGAVTKNVVELKVQFEALDNSYQFMALEFSDDGSNWETLIAWAPNTTAVNELFTGLWVNTFWPLSPDGGDNYFNVVVDEQQTDTGYDEVTGGAYPVDPMWVVHFNLGKDRVLPLDGTSELYLPTDVIDEWHFFNDSTVSNHLHVAFRITYLGNTYWYHVSMGEVDQRGMSHVGMCYVSTSRMLPWAEAADGNMASQGYRHNTLYRSGYLMGGIEESSFIYDEAIGDSSVQYRFSQTGAAFPQANDGNWPSHTGVQFEGKKLVPTALAKISLNPGVDQVSLATSPAPPALGGIGWSVLAHPTTGFVSLGTLPFIMANANAATAAAEWCALGEFPNVRTVRIDSIAVGGEITVGADTWKCFPLLRKTTAAQLINNPRVAQSGAVGIAYKKV